MSSPLLNDEQLEKQYGKRSSGIAIDLPQELGYICPKGHGMDYLTWSEFNEHIWCYECKVDYHYANDCKIKRMCWMSEKFFTDFINRLPIKPQVIEGIQHYPDCYITVKPYKRANLGCKNKTKLVRGYTRLINHKGLKS